MNLDMTHLHLLINHIPVLGVIFAGVLLVVALAYKNTFAEIVALSFTVVFAAATLVTYITGDKAADAVSRLPNVSLSILHQHEVVAKLDLLGMAALGAAALFTLFLYWRRITRPRYLVYALLALLLINTGLLAWTALLGGEIRRPDIALTLLSTTLF
ncbi:MAG TPA: hypothetical protein VH186_12480 [Chloroflexia bacterium]|nr:hypothetical protein [Chloroflexia bacterium]